MIMFFMIVVCVAGVFDCTGVGFAVHRKLQASGRFVAMAQRVTERVIDDFKLRSGVPGISGTLNAFQDVLHELAISKQLQSDLASGNRNDVLCGAIENINRYGMRVLVVQQFCVIFFVPQFNEVPAVRAFRWMCVTSRLAMVVARVIIRARFGSMFPSHVFDIVG